MAQLLERDDFAKRVAAGHPVSVSELLYPLMQAYDSVAVDADVELGGTDQLYNLLAGRTVMEAYGLEPQVVLTTPLLLSWDGAKMSSSVGNNVPLTAAPEEQFGRTMRIPDTMLGRLVSARRGGSPSRTASRWTQKLALARFIVDPLSRRGGRRRGRDALHPRRSRRRCPGRRSGGRPSGRRPDPPTGAARGCSSGSRRATRAG